MTSAQTFAAQVRQHLAAHPARLGTSKLVGIDGPSGSGKTSLAAALGTELADLGPVTVLHTDVYCPGWDGIPALPGMLAALFRDLASGHAGRIREWDWPAGAPGELRVVEPPALVVLEGVGAGALPLARWTTTLVHLDADQDVRKARALERDDYFAAHWDAWSAAEQRYFAEHAVRERADLVLGTG